MRHARADGDHRADAGRAGSVAFLCHAYHRGGVTRWMTEAAAAWHARGPDVWFVAPVPRRPFVSAGNRPTVADLLKGRLPSNRLSGPDVDREFEFGLASQRVRVYAEAVECAVPPGVPLIISDDPDVWAAAAAVADRNPMIGILHADEEFYFALARRYGSRLGGAVGVSERIAARAAAELEGHALPIAAIPCGIHLPAVTPASGGAAEARLLWVGRVDERQKRVTDLPAIVRALTHAGVQCTLDIIGDGPDLGLLRDQVDRSGEGLAARIRFLGWQDGPRIAEHLAASDLLLLPSNFEGMPIVVMEALAAGCAVVASRVSGLEDYERHPRADGCLRLHPVGDVAAAARAVQLALATPAGVRRSRARAFAESEFSLDVCLRRYDDFLARVLAGARPGRPERRRTWAAPSWLSGVVARARSWRVGVAGR